MSKKTILVLCILALFAFLGIFLGMRSDYKTLNMGIEPYAAAKSVVTKPASDFLFPSVNVSWSGDSYKGGKIIVRVPGQKEQMWSFQDSTGNHEFLLKQGSLQKGFDVVMKYYAFGKWHKMKPHFAPFTPGTDKVNLKWTSDVMGLPVLQPEFEIPIPEGK